jgi:hypothetical protein
MSSLFFISKSIFIPQCSASHTLFYPCTQTIREFNHTLLQITID